LAYEGGFGGHFGCKKRVNVDVDALFGCKKRVKVDVDALFRCKKHVNVDVDALFASALRNSYYVFD